MNIKAGTLIIDAFWSSNIPFLTKLDCNTTEGKAFYSNYSGTFKYLGWLDLILLKKIIKERNITHIVLENLNTLGRIAKITKSITICHSYRYNRHYIIRSLSSDIQLSNCQPIYKTIAFGGWDSSDDDTELHIRAESYMRYLLIHTKVKSITYSAKKFSTTASFDNSGNVVFETNSNL